MIRGASRWSWRLFKRGLPVWEYAPLLREAGDALLPVLHLDFGFDTAGYDDMDDEQATSELMERMREAKAYTDHLTAAVTRLTEVRPKDKELQDLHMNFIATGGAISS